MAHVVFTSYAQRDRDRYLERFVEEFREELQGIVVGRDPDELTFFDRDDVQAGDRWSDKIIKAVNEAHVLLCLMSPAYFTRPWCGREVQAFIDRESRLPAAFNGGPFIVPIWWRMPPAPRPLPSRLGQFNYRDAGFPEAYALDGVRGLARQRKLLQVSRVVDTLVKLVGASLAKPDRLPDGTPAANIEEIINAFDEQQPFDVRLLALTTGGDAFKPTQADPTVATATELAAERLAVFIRPLETGPGLSARVKQAQDEQQVLLVVVDAAGAIDPALLEINALNLPSLAVLLIDTNVPATGVDVWLAGIPAGALANAKASGLMRVVAPGDLAAQTERLVEDARRRLMAGAPAAKVEAPNVVERERQQGISTDAVSTLTGPGAGKTP
jgi:hypothetical protein